MKKRVRREHILSFDERLQQSADAARDAARQLPMGRERDALLKARQTEVAAHINEWLASPGLRSPK